MVLSSIDVEYVPAEQLVHGRWSNRSFYQNDYNRPFGLSLAKAGKTIYWICVAQYRPALFLQALMLQAINTIPQELYTLVYGKYSPLYFGDNP